VREELTDLLVVATDVYTWKLLRRDRGLDRPTAEARVRHLIVAVLAHGVPSRAHRSIDCCVWSKSGAQICAEPG